jgi:hypothetical protein
MSIVDTMQPEGDAKVWPFEPKDFGALRKGMPVRANGQQYEIASIDYDVRGNMQLTLLIREV